MRVAALCMVLLAGLARSIPEPKGASRAANETSHRDHPAAQRRWEDVFAELFLLSQQHDPTRTRPPRQLLQRAPPRASKIAPNYALGRTVRMSSQDDHTATPQAAVDGDTWGFFEVKESHAATNPDLAPWIEIDLQAIRQVEALELWIPARRCAHHLIKFSTEEKKEVKSTLEKGRRPAHFCRGGWPSFDPSSYRPLEVQLLAGGSQGATPPVASISFHNRSAIYSWNDIGARAQVVRISVGPGSVTSLHLSEVKVYGPPGSQVCKKATCGAKGSCSRAGLCSCLPNHIGPRCEYHVMGVERYVPNEPDHGWWDEAAYGSYLKHLHAQQSACADPKKMRKHALLPGPGGMGAGLGSTMYFRTGIMTEAFNTNSAYLYYGRFNYALSKYCKAQGHFGTFECYFESMVGCTGVDEGLRKAYKFPAANAKGPNGEDCLIPNSKGQTTKGCNAGPEYFSVPPLYSSRGLFWWRMLQIAYLTRPSEQTMRLLDLEGVKQRIHYAHPIIGLHMRAGDGCRYGIRARMFTCRALKDYLPELRALAMKYGTWRVYLATDDSQAIADSRELREFEWVVAPADRSQLTSDVKIEQRLTGVGGKLDQHSTMVSTLQDLFLLSEADYLVTHQASTLSRMALQLSSLFHKRITPFISMDGPWCPHWRMCCNPNHRTGTSIVC